MTTQLSLEIEPVAPLKARPEVSIMNDAGLLWYDPTGPIADRVQRAAERYWDKYGEGWPNVCQIHPSEMPDYALVALAPGHAVKIVPSVYVMPGHIWIGRYANPDA